MTPAQELMIAGAIGALVTASSLYFDISRGRTQPLIGRNYVKSLNPRSFWIALSISNIVYLAVLFWVVVTGLRAVNL